jgi:hypothetical protein
LILLGQYVVTQKGLLESAVPEDLKEQRLGRRRRIE